MVTRAGCGALGFCRVHFQASPAPAGTSCATWSAPTSTATARATSSPSKPRHPDRKPLLLSGNRQCVLRLPDRAGHELVAAAGPRPGLRTEADTGGREGLRRTASGRRAGPAHPVRGLPAQRRGPSTSTASCRLGALGEHSAGLLTAEEAPFGPGPARCTTASTRSASRRLAASRRAGGRRASRTSAASRTPDTTSPNRLGCRATCPPSRSLVRNHEVMGLTTQPRVYAPRGDRTPNRGPEFRFATPERRHLGSRSIRTAGR